LERINNRIDNSFCFEKHLIQGQAKMKTRMGLALAVIMATALGHVKAGRIEQTRSLVQPIPLQKNGLKSYRRVPQQQPMIPAKGFYCLKIGSNAFFRYPAPKIFRYRVVSRQTNILKRNTRLFFASESGKRYSANGSLMIST
jgi:hypothetical protein